MSIVLGVSIRTIMVNQCPSDGGEENVPHVSKGPNSRQNSQADID